MSGDARSWGFVQRLACRVVMRMHHDHFDENDAPVIGVHVSPIFPPVSPDAGVDADAGARQQ
jgi:hypothetical protein